MSRRGEPFQPRLAQRVYEPGSDKAKYSRQTLLFIAMLQYLSLPLNLWYNYWDGHMKVELGNGNVLEDWDAAWVRGDQERFITLADDYDIWVNLSDKFPHPYTRADAEAWVALQSGRDPVEPFAICDAAGPIGGIGLWTREGDLRHSAEFGYWLGKSFWGRGITTAAAQVVTAYGFETLGLIRIDALVRTDNAASVRVLEKVGYQREGLLRRAILQDGVPVDHLLYAILLED